MVDSPLEKIIEEAIAGAPDLKSLEEVRIRFLGKKGELTRHLRNLVNLPPEERKEEGRRLNQVKELAESLLAGRTGEFRKSEIESRLERERLDVTLPGVRFAAGKIHPITRVTREIKNIFMGMGFEVAEGPEVETEYYNFEALNIPPDHPSREMWDSFYLGEGLLLRSHTSPVQVRVMEKRRPPLRVIVPGRCYRRDAVDASHAWMFHQVEGFMVDRKVTFADLKGVLSAFAGRMFGEERRTSFNPSYFPFTEPSAEMAIDCFACSGAGCSVCKGSGWIEILGAGMIHPAVLRAVGYDPEEFSGFAFGMGIERIALKKYGINDIRLFFENDVRFLKQF
jgi:phenylalanyl-tRNA synthetase alpha chain